MFIPLRDDGPRPRFAVATWLLLGLNVAVYVLQSLLPSVEANRLLYAAGAIPFEISRFTDVTAGVYQTAAVVPPPATIISSLFLHGSIEHLLGNLWFLWVFARSAEAAMGSVRFFAFYLLCGVLAAVAQVIMTPASQTPMIGASGAIAGVLGAYMILFPRAKVELLLFLVVVLQIVVVPAFVALGAWLLWQVVGNRGDMSIATWAHIGGFVVGVLMCKLFAKRTVELGLEPPLANRTYRPPWTLRTAAESSSLPH